MRYARRLGLDEHVGKARPSVQRNGRRRRRLAVAAALTALGLAAAPPLISLAATGTSAGQLYAFGLNRYGELGNETNNKTYEPNPTPTAVTLPGEVGTVVQVAAGEGHSLVLTSTGQLYAFGDNQYGQLGNATNDRKEEPNPTPTPVTLPGKVGQVTQIAAGAHHSLALTSGGQLYAFGENQYGQLGNATNNKSDEPNPTPTTVTLPGEVGTVSQIAAGEDHSLVLTSSGQLFAFGENQYGQLGNATNNKSDEPNPTPTFVTLPGEVGLVTQIAAGGAHSLVLTSSGQVYAFGLNRDGQLGNATNEKSTEPNPTPTFVTLPGEVGLVTQIAAGGDHSLALTSSGQLYAFGYNYSGQLGNATNEKSTEPNPTPTTVTLPGEVGLVTQIAAGTDHSLALTSSGQLYAFGYNGWGQLGDATNNNNEPNPTPALVTLPGGSTIDAIARGSTAEHTLVVIADLAVLTGSLPGGTVGATYSAPVQASGGALPYKWSASGLPPGLSISQANGVISGTPTAAGSYTAAFTVTDDGGIEASVPLAIAIAPSTVPASTSTVPPAIASARQSHSAWREGSKLAQISAKKQPPLGTTFSFSLSEHATVSFSFTEPVAGREVAHKCVAKNRKNAEHNVCKRSVVAGTLTFTGTTGTNKVVFQGRISRAKKLKPSRYTLVITATNTAGQRSAPAKLSFTIVK